MRMRAGCAARAMTAHAHACMLRPQFHAFSQEVARQQAESRQLHISLIQEAEKFDRAEKQHYQQVKKLEDRIAELTYWKQSASEKQQATERENASLRRKIDSLVKLTDKLTAGKCTWSSRAEYLYLPSTKETAMLIGSSLGFAKVCGSRG